VTLSVDEPAGCGPAGGHAVNAAWLELAALEVG